MKYFTILALLFCVGCEQSTIVDPTYDTKFYGSEADTNTVSLDFINFSQNGNRYATVSINIDNIVENTVFGVHMPFYVDWEHWQVVDHRNGEVVDCEKANEGNGQYNCIVDHSQYWQDKGIAFAFGAHFNSPATEVMLSCEGQMFNITFVCTDELWTKGFSTYWTVGENEWSDESFYFYSNKVPFKLYENGSYIENYPWYD